MIRLFDEFWGQLSHDPAILESITPHFSDYLMGISALRAFYESEEVSSCCLRALPELAYIWNEGKIEFTIDEEMLSVARVVLNYCILQLEIELDLELYPVSYSAVWLAKGLLGVSRDRLLWKKLSSFFDQLFVSFSGLDDEGLIFLKYASFLCQSYSLRGDDTGEVDLLAANIIDLEGDLRSKEGSYTNEGFLLDLSVENRFNSHWIDLTEACLAFTSEKSENVNLVLQSILLQRGI